jgi:hypothetical protein
MGLRRRAPRRGQSLVELALALPVIILLAVGVADLGRAFFYATGNGGYTINGTVIVSTALMSANGGLTLNYDPNQNYNPPGGSGLVR